VKDLLIIMPKFETLQEFIAQAITCNNWLFERRQEKRFGWENTNHTMISTSSTSEKNALGPEPIQIDAARYKPLSQGKNDRRGREGLRFYCGSSKHKLLECPIKPKGLKARSATSMESGTLENRDVRSQ
jgi:hypothetical protein